MQTKRQTTITQNSALNMDSRQYNIIVTFPQLQFYVNMKVYLLGGTQVPPRATIPCNRGGRRRESRGCTTGRHSSMSFIACIFNYCTNEVAKEKQTNNPASPHPNQCPMNVLTVQDTIQLAHSRSITNLRKSYPLWRLC